MNDHERDQRRWQYEASKKCQCPNCRISHALAEVADAREEQLNLAEETSMSYAHVVDEVQAVLGLAWWRPWRSRLRKALAVAGAVPIARCPRHRDPQTPPRTARAFSV